MGTSWSVELAQRLTSAELSALNATLTGELIRINQLMSTYDAESELSRFNRLQSVEPVTLAADTLLVLDTAIGLSVKTAGAYDVTLGSVIDLWGFGADDVADFVPGSERIQQAMALTGYRQLVRVGNTVRKRHPGLRIDLSSLAKGFAVDQLGLLIEAAGIDNYIAEIGGELRARGFNVDGDAWRIGIEQPDGTIETGVAVSNANMASSGSYRNYRMVKGQRYTHIIDGRTGMPINHDLAAVTVLHRSTLLADAWATALMVLGAEAAWQLANNESVAMQLTVAEDEGFKLLRSAGFLTSHIK